MTQIGYSEKVIRSTFEAANDEANVTQPNVRAEYGARFAAPADTVEKKKENIDISLEAMLFVLAHEVHAVLDEIEKNVESSKSISVKEFAEFAAKMLFDRLVLVAIVYIIEIKKQLKFETLSEKEIEGVLNSYERQIQTLVPKLEQFSGELNARIEEIAGKVYSKRDVRNESPDAFTRTFSRFLSYYINNLADEVFKYGNWTADELLNDFLGEIGIVEKIKVQSAIEDMKKKIKTIQASR